MSSPLLTLPLLLLLLLFLSNSGADSFLESSFLVVGIGLSCSVAAGENLAAVAAAAAVLLFGVSLSFTFADGLIDAVVVGLFRSNGGDKCDDSLFSGVFTRSAEAAEVAALGVLGVVVPFGVVATFEASVFCLSVCLFSVAEIAVGMGTSFPTFSLTVAEAVATSTGFSGIFGVSSAAGTNAGGAAGATFGSDTGDVATAGVSTSTTSFVSSSAVSGPSDELLASLSLQLSC